MKKKQIKIKESTLFIYKVRENSTNAAQSTDPTVLTITSTKSHVV